MRRCLVLLVALAFGLATYGTVPAQAIPCGQGCYGQMVPGKYLMGQSAPSDQLTFENYSSSTVRIEYNDPTYGAQSATVNRSGDGNGNGDSAILCADETYQYDNFVTITYGVGTANPQTETVPYYSRSGGGNDDVAMKQQLLNRAVAQYNKAMAKFHNAKKTFVKAKKALDKAKKGKKHRAAKKVRKARAAVKKALVQLNRAKATVRSAKSDVVTYRAQFYEARRTASYCADLRLR